MKPEEAALLAQCHREGLPGVEEARIAKAVRTVEKEAGFKEELEQQRKLDADHLAALEEVALPPALLARIAAAVPAETKPFSGKNALRQPVIQAILIGALVLLSWGGYTLWNREHSFPGKDDVMRMVEVNDEMSDTAMEPKSSKVGALDDWFFSKYGFEDFYVPAGFTDYEAALARLFKQDGMPVAQVAVEDHHMIFYSFKADDFGVQVQPNGAWRIFDDGEWIAAVQQHDEECFMVAFRGIEVRDGGLPREEKVRGGMEPEKEG